MRPDESEKKDNYKRPGKGILCKGQSDRNVDLGESSGNLFLKVYFCKIAEGLQTTFLR